MTHTSSEVFELVIGENSGDTGEEDRWSILLGVPDNSKDGKGGESGEGGEILLYVGLFCGEAAGVFSSSILQSKCVKLLENQPAFQRDFQHATEIIDRTVMRLIYHIYSQKYWCKNLIWQFGQNYFLSMYNVIIYYEDTTLHKMKLISATPIWVT